LETLKLEKWDAGKNGGRKMEATPIDVIPNRRAAAVRNLLSHGARMPNGNLLFSGWCNDEPIRISKIAGNEKSQSW
jgi:hypothetical protein